MFFASAVLPFWTRLFAKVRELFCIDRRSLALLRVGLGTVVLADIISRAGDLQAHYTDAGVLPTEAANRLLSFTPGQWSIHLLGGGWLWQAMLFWVAAVAAVAVIIGYWTRVSTIVTWVLLASVQSRNVLVLFHGDHLLRLFLFWSIFLPLGARFSMDARNGRAGESESSPSVFSAATVAIMLQLCLMYWFTAAHKTDAVWTESRWALYYALNNDMLVTSFGKWVAGFPELTRWLTGMTLWLEWWGPALLFVPVFTGKIRVAVVAAFLGLHLGILACLDIPLFSFVCIVCWSVFMPGWLWDKVAAVRHLARSSRAAKSPDEEAVESAASPRSGKPWGKQLGINVLVGLLFAYVAIYCLHVRFPNSLSWYGPRCKIVANVLRLEQKWTMFAPYPTRRVGWFVVPATLRDGSKVDLFAGGQRLDWEKPDLVSNTFESDRWREYLLRLRFQFDVPKQLRPYYIEYLNRRWREQYGDQREIRNIEFYFVREETRPYPQTPTPERILLYPDAEQSTVAGTDVKPRVDDESAERIVSAPQQKLVDDAEVERKLASLVTPSQSSLPLDAPRIAEDRFEKDSPGDLWRRYLRSGDILLRIGHEREAIEQLKTASRLIPEIQDQIPRAWARYTIFRLGLAYLRLGETENCCRRNTPDSCIMPIQGGGVHEEKEGSRQAIIYFSLVLQDTSPKSPLHLKCKWLLNIAYMTIGGYPQDVPEAYLIPPEVFESEAEFPRFPNIAAKVGLDTFSECGGAIVDDFDNDGDFDVVTSTWNLDLPMHFFRNEQNGQFTDQSKAAGLQEQRGGLNMVQADFNNDGHLDILVLRGAWRNVRGDMPNALLRNNGDGTFEDVAERAGLTVDNYPTQTGAWADYDNDGDLDLYVGNEHGRGVTAPCQLFRNNGDETFTDVTEEAGVDNLRFAKGVVWGDYNNDRYPDIYVSNLQEPNRLYRNNGDGTFTDIAVHLGVDGPNYSFPVWFWDVDNDGVLDLYVSSYYGASVSDAILGTIVSYLGWPTGKMELARLYRGDGKGNFDEVAGQYNLRRQTLPMGANFGDLNNDGYLDFYLGTGYDNLEALVPNVMYLNQGGTRFADVTTAGGFGHLQKGHAIAFADLDNDGDQDVFEQMGGALPSDKYRDALFENPGFDNHWITVQLVGVRSNRSAIGAHVRVDVTDDGKQRSIYRHVNSGGSFGANPLRQTIGLGKASKIDQLEIYWPTTDVRQMSRNVATNQFIRVTEDVLEFESLDVESFRLGGTSKTD